MGNTFETDYNDKVAENLKNGRNIVKNDLVKFEAIYPFTLTINEYFQKLCGLGVIELNYEGRQG